MEAALFSALPQAVKEILRRFDEAGREAYVVGGCVRDVLLGRTVHDWDLCSAASPQQVAELFCDCRVLPTGQEHGTVTLLYEGAAYEITMFRCESDYDGRKPHSVRAARTIQEDLARRDFTVNAMAYHPARGLIDCYDGQSDLKNRQLRAVGQAEERFREDYLRILRGLRFSACYGLDIEEESGRAMRRCAGGLRLLSGERIWQELSRLLTGKEAGGLLAAYDEVLAQLWDGFALSVEDGQKLDAMPPQLWGRLAFVLGFCRDKEAILDGLRCPRQGKERVKLLWKQCGSHKRGCAWLADFPEKFRRQDMEAALWLMDRQQELALYEAILDSGQPLSMGELAIGGKDLQKLGLRGPDIGQTLEQALQAVWNKQVNNDREELLAFIMLQREKRKKS